MNGFEAIKRDFNKAIPNPQKPNYHQFYPLPETPLCKFILDYVTGKLSKETLNHSLRVYQYCLCIIKDQFTWELSNETLFITCVLHDIATTDENLNNTNLSFEFHGGMISYDLILNFAKQRSSNVKNSTEVASKEIASKEIASKEIATKEVAFKEIAEAVCEAIIRHQDLGTTGYITTLGLILQLATVYDNIGMNPHLLHKTTVKEINQRYPRSGWLDCFANTIDKENKLKPWGHTSSIETFAHDVKNNNLQYE